jgi:hypothetical protein
MEKEVQIPLNFTNKGKIFGKVKEHHEQHQPASTTHLT